jgi:hypothetical protein
VRVMASLLVAMWGLTMCNLVDLTLQFVNQKLCATKIVIGIIALIVSMHKGVIGVLEVFPHAIQGRSDKVEVISQCRGFVL